MIALKYSMASKHEMLQGRELGGLVGCESSASFFVFVFLLYVFSLKGLTPHLAACALTCATCWCHHLLPCPQIPCQEKAQGGVELWWINKGTSGRKAGSFGEFGLWSLTQNHWPREVFPKLLQHKPGEQEWLMEVLFVWEQEVSVFVYLCDSSREGQADPPPLSRDVPPELHCCRGVLMLPLGSHTVPE